MSPCPRNNGNTTISIYSVISDEYVGQGQQSGWAPTPRSFMFLFVLLVVVGHGPLGSEGPWGWSLVAKRGLSQVGVSRFLFDVVVGRQCDLSAVVSG